MDLLLIVLVGILVIRTLNTVEDVRTQQKRMMEMLTRRMSSANPDDHRP